MSQPYIGQIIPVGFNFAPVGWLPCDGRTLQIADYDTLYTLIGTAFGGNGQTNFNLPNLNGRTALGVGSGTGLSTYVIGQPGGTEMVSINATQLGGHSHLVSASSHAGATNTPGTNTVLAVTATASPEIYGPAVAGIAMASTAIGPAGTGLPHENRQPFVTINYIIAVFGIFPTQS